MTTSPKLKLNNGIEIDQIGLGLWLNKDEKECIDAINAALECGYRHLDSAQVYGNEQFVGKAISESGLKREELFITTKNYNNLDYRNVIPSYDESLEKLKTDYVDLFLIHFPVTELRRPAWHKMQELYESGRVKSIGVSNYTIKHLEELLNECDIKPVVNQVELHVYLQQKELREYCAKNDILIEAYSPLAHGYGLDNESLAKIASKHGKSTAQIMLKWCAQDGMVVLPKSVSATRIAENIDIYDFELDDEDLAIIADLDRNYRTCWDPTNIA